MPHNVFDVAALIVTEQHRRGRDIDKLQLQKFLYETKGLHFALWGDAAFGDPASAYDRGPVFVTVEQSYRTSSEGWHPIEKPVGGHPESVTAPVRASVMAVLDKFGHLSGGELEANTKLPGSLWNVTRDANPDKRAPEIPEPLIVRRYRGERSASDDANVRLIEAAAAGDVAALSALR